MLEKKHGRKLPPKDWALTGAKDRSQNIVRSLWLKEGILEEINKRIQARYAQIVKNEVLCEQYEVEDADIVL